MIHSVGMRGAERPEAPVPPLPKGPLASSPPSPPGNDWASSFPAGLTRLCSGMGDGALRLALFRAHIANGDRERGSYSQERRERLK